MPATQSKPSVPVKNQVLTSPLTFPVSLTINSNNSIIGYSLFHLYLWHVHHISTLPKIKIKNKKNGVKTSFWFPLSLVINAIFVTYSKGQFSLPFHILPA